MLTDRFVGYIVSCYLVVAEGFRGYWISLLSRAWRLGSCCSLKKTQLLQVESIQALQRGGAN